MSKLQSLRVDANMAISAIFDMLGQMRSPAKSQRKVVRKDQLHYWRSPHNLGCVSQDSYPRKSFLRRDLKNWDRNTSSNSPKAPGTKSKFGKEMVHRKELFKRVSLMGVVLARLSLMRRGHKRKLCTKNDARPQSSTGFGETYLQAQECRQSFILFFYWSRGNAGTYFKISRRVRIRCRFRSVNVHDEEKRVKVRWIGYFVKIQEPHCGAYSQWRSAYKRGSTSIRSRPQSLRDSAISRTNACCSIAWKTLRRPRIFLWVGQQSKTMVDQRRDDNYVQNGQLRTSCCSRVIHQSW